MSGLPENLIVTSSESPKGKPDKVKYSAADIIRGAYCMLLAEKPAYIQKRIINELDGYTSSEFARDVARFVDNPENLPAIEKFLTVANPPAKVTA